MSQPNQKLTALDLLELPLAAASGIARNASGFHVEGPWALARFGSLPLQAGWWQIDCEVEQSAASPELRLSAPSDPLITVRVEAGSQARIYLQEGDYDVSLLVSAWPGNFQFRRLAFLRIDAFTETKMIAGALARLSRRKRPWEIAARAARRLMAGQSMGVRSGASAPPSAPAEQEAAAIPRASEERRVIRQGDIVAHLRKGDRLHADAFRIIEAEFARQPGLQALFADADESGRIVSHPEWDSELTTLFPYPDAPVFLRTGSAAEQTVTLAEIAARHGADTVGRIALPLVSRQGSALVTPLVPQTVLSRTPRVSVIIPTKTRIDLLALCVEGLRNQTAYPDLQVVIVDNGATDPTFPAVLKIASESFDLVKVDDFGPFNFSRLINHGACKADGEILLLLNDDVVAQEPGWLHRMVASALQPDVGAVGARLTYADLTIQHAGVALGLGGVCGHLWKGTSQAAAAANPYISLPGQRLAVTAACLAVRKDVFTQARGFDEALAVALNDIDFCLRLHSGGLKTIYRGDAWLIHHESQSRGDDDASLARRRRLLGETRIFLDRWKDLIGRDPFSSPAFDATLETGAVHPAAFARDGYEPVR